MIKNIYHAVPFPIWAALLWAVVIPAYFFIMVFLSLWVEGVRQMKLSNKTYDILKYIAQYILPALGTLYFAISNIWGLPYGEQIVGTITAIDAFLGAVLGISSYNYKEDGNV